MERLYLMLQRFFMPRRGALVRRASARTVRMNSRRTASWYKSSDCMYSNYVNIFVLSEDPIEAARMMCDKHVIKMILESGQMLCAAHPEGIAPWKRSHYSHPCTVWTRTSRSNYEWLAAHALTLCEEYTKRYGRRHGAEDVILWCAENIPNNIPEGCLTPFVVAIKDRKYHRSTTVESYRAYYLGDKVRFARWKHCPPPDWWRVNVQEVREI